jgi:zinc transporter 9
MEDYSSFLAGSLPLSFSLSQRSMRLISAIGTGLLVGTALIVIIPEGIETMYAANALSTHSSLKTDSMEEDGKTGAMAALAAHGVGPQQQQNEESGRAEELAHLSGRALHWALGALVKRAAEAKEDVGKPHPHGSGHGHEHEGESSHAWIGVGLVFGFILMYLIDAMQKPAPARGHHIPLTEMDSEDSETPTTVAGAPKAHSKSTTIGLVIHSFADGIALGASSADAETQSTLGVIVFIAILVHKAPAAFGLTSVLLKQGLSKRAARGHLLVFSLAAPLGALVTWVLVNLLGSSDYAGAASGSSTWWTGLVLVFSGGTFL